MLRNKKNISMFLFTLPYFMLFFLMLASLTAFALSAQKYATKVYKIKHRIIGNTLEQNEGKI